jgi:hypothetical protein
MDWCLLTFSTPTDPITSQDPTELNFFVKTVKPFTIEKSLHSWILGGVVQSGERELESI